MSVQIPVSLAKPLDGASALGAREPLHRPSGGATAPGRPSSVVALTRQNVAGDVDLAQVQALRDAIRRGELRIDTSRIADGLLDGIRELLR